MNKGKLTTAATVTAVRGPARRERQSHSTRSNGK
ncbi:uncharacterized protein G2W53_023996 [Senna tora]|uniref:Uncharacterized protein n=1 Tax=Senna tora TaxID=362788 RepID=A0A834WGJ4_9FABA|nr:uncharacterized protein G2W53_023996 [Senna tora]